MILPWIKILNAFDNLVISEHEVEWIKNDDRACHFIYHQLKNSFIIYDNDSIYVEKNQITNDLIVQHKNKKQLQHHSNLQDINLHPIERYKDILYLLDSCIVSKKLKLSFLSQLKVMYEQNKSYCDFSMFNDNHASWVNRYTQEKLITELGIFSYPQTDKDMDTAKLNFDILTANKLTKKAFITQLKAAYRKKVSRERDKEKIFNITLTNDTAILFNELTEWRGVSKSKIIDDLVREAHKKEKLARK